MKNARFTAGVFLLMMFSLFVVGQTPVKSIIIRAKCVGCGDCVRSCPVQAITLIKGKAVVDPEKCVGCRLCVITCSYGAPQ